MDAFLKAQAALPSHILQGRYVTQSKIDVFLKDFNATEIGRSVKGTPIHSLRLGNGPIKVLLWSQMHGNESTSTKGLFDVLYYLKQTPALLDQLTLEVIPMLNPDGAQTYTRVNANHVDLNRDAQDQSQPEINILFKQYDAFKPDYCFNLHDQRTIFGVDNKACMLSFLSPAADVDKTITPARKRAMGIIGYVNEILQQYIPGQIGRYDDTFNGNCVGDCFQSKGTPTLLFESGQSGLDYSRKETRKWFGVSVLAALEGIANELFKPAVYASIPEVEKSFVDVLVRRISKKDLHSSLAIYFNEVLKDNTIQFVPSVHSTGSLSHLNAHKIIYLDDFCAKNGYDMPAENNTEAVLKMLNLTHYSH